MSDDDGTDAIGWGRTPEERGAHYDSLLVWLRENAPDLDGRAAIATKAVLVVEWSDDNGERWLTMLDGPQMVGWDRRGLLHETLYFWPDGS